jgi:hypothetical protein
MDAQKALHELCGDDLSYNKLDNTMENDENMQWDTVPTEMKNNEIFVDTLHDILQSQ